YAFVACQSSMQRSPPVHRRGSGACPDTRRSNKPYATTISPPSVFPASSSPPKLNPVEPPWYGPVCPVVGEGWHRESSPYPDLRRISPVAAHSGDRLLFEPTAGTQPFGGNRSSCPLAVIAGMCPSRRVLPRICYVGRPQRVQIRGSNETAAICFTSRWNCAGTAHGVAGI